MSAAKINITAAMIVRLLEQKHAKDIFVAECKDGPTHVGSHLRMDGWAMPRSWSNPQVSAYEIKVSRQDFLQDNKWPAYLEYCNLFYFVTPPKLIDQSELPDGVGLIECTRNAARLLTRRKAAHRKVEIPESLFRYVLMSRATITPPNLNHRDSRAQWEAWLRQREKDRTLGYRVRGKIREIYAENVEKVQRENAALRNRIAGLEKAERILASMGIVDVDSWRIEDRIREARSGISRQLRMSLESARSEIDKLCAVLDK